MTVLGVDIALDQAAINQAANEALAVSDALTSIASNSNEALPSNAFGLMCSPLFLPIYTITQTVFKGLVNAEAGSIERSANNLKKVMGILVETDDNEKRSIEDFSGGSIGGCF
jgi:hypothetical protein